MKKVNFTKETYFKFCFYAYCLALGLEFLYWFILSLSPENFSKCFSNFTISDWLINYEAGFVRRGLWGQIFFYLYDWFGINVGYLIYLLSYIFLFIFIYIFIREWRRNNLSLFLLPSVCLLGAFAMSYLSWFRRDILIFLLIWLIFKNYRFFIEGKKINLFYLYFLSIITLLSHEASFFYFVPLLGLHYFLYLKNNGFWGALGNALLLISPMILVMLFCVIYKGNMTMAHEIWHSWDHYFISEFGKILPIGNGCAALGWNGMDTFKMHFTVNYLTSTFGVYHFCIWPIIFICVYYLLIQVNKIKIGMRNNENLNDSFIVILSRILIYQFIFLLPMFTVLSCDFRRVILYWTLSSFLFCFGLGDKLLKVFYYRKVSKCHLTFNKMLSTGLLGKNYVYLIVFVSLGIPFVGFSIIDYYYSTVLGNIVFVLKYTIYFVYGA